MKTTTLEPSRKLPDDLSATFDGHSIKPLPQIKLMGCHLDKHPTFGVQCDAISKNFNVCGSIPESLRFLLTVLLSLAYLALI